MRLADPVQNRQRIIPLDGLSQISRSRQVMMHAAIKDQELLTARDLHIVYPSHVYASFSNQITTWLNQEMGSRENRIATQFAHKGVDCFPPPDHIQLLLV